MNKLLSQQIIRLAARRPPIYLLVLLLLTGSAASCKKYLDARPDQTQVVPATLQDLQALLDNVSVMNRSFPSYGEAAADNYYFPQANYDALVTAEDKTLYNWDPAGVVVNGQWLSPYQVVFYANQVLEGLGKAGQGPPSAGIRGAALFFRAYAFLQVASLFSKPYDPATSAADPGIPLRLSSDFNLKSVRASNEQSYQQILADFKSSVRLLPAASAFPSQPVRIAAYAAIARTYLAMGLYTQAGLYADSCLQLSPPLLDYNTLSKTSANPIPRFNKETIFYAMSSGSALLVPSKAKVDSTLYRSYAANDLRKSIFYKNNNDGTFSFKGNYDGSQSSVIFSGLATDELYLIAAECQARAGQTDAAMALLNTLLQARWKTGTFQPLGAANAPAALALVLAERRKELVFRGLRWTDLRRLNRESGLQTTLLRKLGQAVYQLPPGDPRYTMLIPQEVITLSGIAQNPR